MEGRDGGLTTAAAVSNKGMVEIDMRPPFRSVKEAVYLFGERVLTADYHTPKIAQKRNGSNPESMITELEITKHNLEKAQQETKSLANQMSYLKEELENTERELQELKNLQESKRQLTKMMADLQDMEDLKYVKNSPQRIVGDDEEEEEEEEEEGKIEFQKKRYVTSFAYPTPSKINVLPAAGGRAVLERHPSLKKNKKKNPFDIPLIGGIFQKRRTKCNP